MNIIPGWYRTRSAGLARVRFICERDKDYKYSGEIEEGAVLWLENGRYGNFGESPQDLVEYLPQCTGWDWKPTIDDLMREVAKLREELAIYKDMEYRSDEANWDDVPEHF